MAKRIESKVPPRHIPRADVVGSLLRPKAMKDAIDGVYEPRHTALLQEERDKDRGDLREVEDRVIADLVRRQVDIGLDVVSDGEMRRYMFVNSFYDAVDGLAPSDRDIVFFDKSGDEMTFPGPASITGKLKKVDSPAAREAAPDRRRVPMEEARDGGEGRRSGVASPLSGPLSATEPRPEVRSAPVTGSSGSGRREPSPRWRRRSSRRR